MQKTMTFEERCRERPFVGMYCGRPLFVDEGADLRRILDSAPGQVLEVSNIDTIHIYDGGMYDVNRGVPSADWSCAYCGNENEKATRRCHVCGAPKTKEE
jgi:hypothetical protein